MENKNIIKEAYENDSNDYDQMTSRSFYDGSTYMCKLLGNIGNQFLNTFGISSALFELIRI